MQGVLKDNNLKFALAPIEVLYYTYFTIIRNKMEIILFKIPLKITAIQKWTVHNPPQKFILKFPA